MHPPFMPNEYMNPYLNPHMNIVDESQLYEEPQDYPGFSNDHSRVQNESPDTRVPGLYMGKYNIRQQR